jgi:uncharacterized protein YcnI
MAFYVKECQCLVALAVRVLFTTTLLLASGLVLLVTASPAEARVSIVPGAVKGGGTETFAIRLANEREDTSSDRLELVLPPHIPLAVQASPRPGWTVTINRRSLEPPAKVDGTVVDEVAESIVWEGGRVGPGQFEQFIVTLGGLPRDGLLSFTVIQRYTNGDVDKWTNASVPGGRAAALPTVTLGSGIVATPPPRAVTPTARNSPAGEAPAESVEAADTSDRQTGSVNLTLLVGLVLMGAGLLMALGLALSTRTRGSRAAVAGDANEKADKESGGADREVGEPAR